MRLSFWTNSPHTNTGYALQTRHILPLFVEAGHQVAVFANYGLSGNRMPWKGTSDRPIPGDGVTIYPLKEKRQGEDVIPYYVDHFKADAVISLYDMWSLPKNSKQLLRRPWISLIPVDGAPVSRHMLARINQVDWPISYCKFGREELLKAGVETDYIPHCIDLGVFKPGDKMQAREDMGLPKDRYIISIIAANKGLPPRKSWPEMLAAFKLFVDKHPEAFLYCHTTKTPFGSRGEGIYFDSLMADLKLPPASVGFPHQGRLALGIPDRDMAKIYQASDVKLLASRGEGFGIPVLEAQACGCPVVTHDCSAMSELTVNGVAVPRGRKQWVQRLEYYWHVPDVEEIYGALEDVYAWDDETKEKSKDMGLDFAGDYSINAVWENYWLPFIEKVERRIW